MDWKLAVIALGVAITLWFTINIKNAGSGTLLNDPEYGIQMDDGSVKTIPLRCDQMEAMLAIAEVERLKRQMEAQGCGTDHQSECLTFYYQWSMLEDFILWLNLLMEENCKTN